MNGSDSAAAPTALAGLVQAMPLMEARRLAARLDPGLRRSLQFLRVTALRRCGDARALLTTRKSQGELSPGRRDKSGDEVVDRTAAHPSERSIVRANEVGL